MPSPFRDYVVVFPLRRWYSAAPALTEPVLGAAGGVPWPGRGIAPDPDCTRCGLDSASSLTRSATLALSTTPCSDTVTSATRPESRAAASAGSKNLAVEAAASIA